MQNPYYLNTRHFMPSNETLKQWMKTRKTQSTSIPGLFETIEFAKDQLWAIIAILIESAALILTTYGAWQIYLSDKTQLMFFVTAIIVVVLFIAFDIIGIMLHGDESPKKVEIKNKLIAEKDLNERRELIRELESISWRQFLGTMLFLLSGALKILAIMLCFNHAGPIVLPLLTIFYLVVIYIHLFHTGYWLAAIKTKKLLTREEKEWFANKQTNVPNPFMVDKPDVALFSTHMPIPITPGQKKYDYNRATISFLEEVNHPDGSKTFDYRLENYGCLWDEDIHGLISQFPSRISMDIIEACKRLQLSQFRTL